MALSKYKSIILNDILNFDLIIKGQGVLIFSNNDSLEDCYFKIYNDEKKDGLKIIFTKDNVKVIKIGSSKRLNDKNNNKGLIDSKGAYYWFSIDSQNQRLYAGIGEVRLDTIIYNYNLKHSDKLFLESIVSMEISKKSKF